MVNSVQESRVPSGTATSPDGWTFRLGMSPHRVFPIGSLVSPTDDEDVVRLAQVETHQLLPDGQMQAAGRVLGALGPNGLDDSAMEVFGSATVAEADPKMIDRLNSGAGGSGSGKTYALGVLLEEVLLHTELPLIIFDPNGDFVRIQPHHSSLGRQLETQLCGASG